MKIWTIEEEAEKLKQRFAGINRAAFARENSVKGGQSMIYQHISARRPISLEAALAYAKGFHCGLEEISPRLAMESAAGASLTTKLPASTSGSERRRIADYELVSADETDGEVGEIEYWDARGSCGGGFLNYEQLPKGHLVKESTFFHKYGVKPADVFAIYADGDSMADFIVDGDIVIFDRRKTSPRSGKIYAIDHPDGLKIKMLRRDISGAWTLESKNVDKRMFPDERIEPDQFDLLKIHGEFVYRQGG